ncbi:MAG: hypothetical protein KY464_04050 [Gemmatimonadetes bacterium]|nr:hypothetical protein [Gemmatimonadota bacterium]
MPRLEDPSIPLLSPARDLLRRFAAAWVSAAVKGLPGAADDGGGVGVLVVEGFAGADYPAGSASMPGITGAAMRLMARERTRALVRAVMVEEDPAKVDWLAEVVRQVMPGELLHLEGELKSGLNLRSGALAVLEALGPELVRSRRSLVVLDPSTAGALPLGLLKEWVGIPGAELLLRFPSADLRRLGRYRGAALADLPPHGKRMVDGVSRLLGDPRHDWLHRWVPALERGLEEALDAVANLYAGRLQRDGLIARRVCLGPGEGAEQVFLLTRDAASGLLLNEVVHGLRGEGVLPWPSASAGPVRYAPAEELALFGRGDAPACGCDRVVDRPLLANSLAARFAGSAVRLEEILLCHVETDLFAEDLRRALLDLRRDGRALFRSLGGDAEITFRAIGARAMHRPRSGKRSARPQDLTLGLG